MEYNVEALNRWRLILGRFADSSIPLSSEVQYVDMDELLEFLYGREYGEDRGVRELSPDRKGSLDPSMLTVPRWLTRIRELFPRQTVEILEKHALDRYQLNELLTDKTVLEKLEPNYDLLKNILHMKHLMHGEVLETARKIVKQVADEIIKSLETDIQRAIVGRIDKSKGGGIRSARNIDFKKTIQRNLKNYDYENKRLLVEKVYFHPKVRVYNPWRVIVAVDESGSMLDSVVYSAVMAGIFTKLPMLKTNLVIFDTNVVDLSGYVDDPVQTLMSVQLGGGTNIAKALQYCSSLLENPYKTIVVLVTDLYEGGGYANMFARAKDIIESGAKLIVLTALNMEAVSAYDRGAAKKMAALGAEVAAMTPGGLAEWIAQIIS